MSSGPNRKSKTDVKPLTNTELGLYAAMVLLTAFTQLIMQSGRSLPETFAWIIVYAFLIGVVFFGWARVRTEGPSESKK